VSESGDTRRQALSVYIEGARELASAKILGELVPLQMAAGRAKIRGAIERLGSDPLGLAAQLDEPRGNGATPAGKYGKGSRQQIKALILAALPGITGEIAVKTGLPSDRVSGALNYYLKTGQVARIGRSTTRRGGGYWWRRADANGVSA